MYPLQRNEKYRLGDNAPKSYVVHRRLTKKQLITYEIFKLINRDCERKQQASGQSLAFVRMRTCLFALQAGQSIHKFT